MKLLEQLKSRNVKAGVASILSAVVTHVIANPAVLTAPTPPTVILFIAGVVQIYLRNTERRPVAAIDNRNRGG